MVSNLQQGTKYTMTPVPWYLCNDNLTVTEANYEEKTKYRKYMDTVGAEIG
jgi:hypothetical protein